MTGHLDDHATAPVNAGEAVLRNLSAKQYIRDSVLASSDYGYSLGEAVCIRMHWTDDPSGTDGLGCWGDWIGHRFDIVLMRDSDIAKELAGWEDVSDTAVTLFERCMRGDTRHRDEWRQRMSSFGRVV